MFTLLALRNRIAFRNIRCDVGWLVSLTNTSSRCSYKDHANQLMYDIVTFHKQMIAEAANEEESKKNLDAAVAVARDGRGEREGDPKMGFWDQRS